MSTSLESSGDDVGQTSLELDPVHMRILTELRENGRISMAALAEKVGVSRANVYARVDALIASGVITGFSAQVDERRTGLGVPALVFVTVYPQKWPEFRERIRALTEIEYCVVTTGEHDAMLQIRSRDVGETHDFVTGVLSALPEIKSLETVLILDEVVSLPYLLPTDLAERPRSTPIGMTRFRPARR